MRYETVNDPIVEVVLCNLPFFLRKTNEKRLKTLNFKDKNKIKGKVNSIMIEFLV